MINLLKDKKTLRTIIIAVVIVVAGVAAFMIFSKPNTDRLYGKWKVAAEMPNIEAIYEFAQNKMLIEIKGLDIPNNKIETTYKVKSDDGKTIILEVVHPVTKQTGDFSINIDGNKMKMIDPDGQSVDLIKN